MRVKISINCEVSIVAVVEVEGEAVDVSGNEARGWTRVKRVTKCEVVVELEAVGVDKAWTGAVGAGTGRLDGGQQPPCP